MTFPRLMSKAGCGLHWANNSLDEQNMLKNGWLHVAPAKKEPIAGPPGVSTPSDLRPQEGAGNEDIDSLRATLASKGVKFDKRWGTEKLKGLL